MNKDLNKIAKIEKAIAKKYGKKAILNPKSQWTPAKEKKHLESAKKFYKKCNKSLELKKINNKAQETIESIKSCPTCSRFFLTPKDEVYMKKFDCCHWCYVEYVEDREERWFDGWRPDKESVFKKS